jgi:signal transduction histidine kinase
MFPASPLSALLDLLYTQAKGFVGVYDRQLGWFTHVNPAGVRLLGYASEQEFLADPDHSLRTPPWTATQWQALCDNTQRRGRQELEVQIRCHAGGSFLGHLELAYSELGGQPLFLICLTEHNRLQEAEQELIAQHQRVARLNAELEQKVADRTHALLITLEQLEKRGRELTQALAAEQQLGELKSRFVSMASHEFRTPLTVVLSSAALIDEYPRADQHDKRRKHIQRIQESVNHLNNILEEFLSVGSIEEGNLTVHPVMFDLNELLTDALGDVQSLLKPGQRIEQQVQCPVPFRLDASLMRKILVNLLSNAIKYSDNNSVVRLAAGCHRSQLRISVQDQGIGISPEDQQQLFKPFSRARNVANVHGTGLGLYIVAQYLALMSGTIKLHSAPGQGTTVTISIPYENHPAD